jgi:uncharacterized protein (DUF1697 family)
MLRAVNVGTRNRIAMSDLRALYVSMGLHEPETWVQSGNVVFETGEADAERVARRIEETLERAFGFRSDVIVRSAAELRDVVSRNPFATRTDVHPSKLLVLFLAGEPPAEIRERVASIKPDPEELHLSGRELFIHFPNGMARPKLSLTALGRALKLPATGRNWNTVVKLLQLAEARSC